MPLVQSATSATATVVLNGVAAGNLLVVLDTYFRSTSTGAVDGTPTDSNGTFSVACNDTPIAAFGGFDIGVAIFYQQNTASGTHTVTPQANTDHNTTLMEFSGIVTSGAFVAGSKSSGGNGNFAGTSISTGSTATAASAGDIAIIGFAAGATTGTANMGLTDPVSGFTTVYVQNNTSSGLGTMHSYRALGSGGTQSATFNWTDSETQQFVMAAIATFVASSGGGGTGPNLVGRQVYVLP